MVSHDLRAHGCRAHRGVKWTPLPRLAKATKCVDRGSSGSPFAYRNSTKAGIKVLRAGILTTSQDPGLTK